MAGYNRPDHTGRQRTYVSGNQRYDARRPVRRPVKRRKKNSAMPIIVIAGTILLIALVIIIAVAARGGRQDKTAYDPAAEGGMLVNVLTDGLATATPEPTPEPTPSPEPTPAPAADYGISLPAPTEEGYLPVIRRAETSEKIIAITVDDCYQFKNTRTITDLILSHGGNFTLFPIGKNILREELYDTLHYCYENGVEIENHTYEHRPHYNRDDEGMARQVYMNKACLDYVLGVDYQHHFFRPMGGDGRDDQRLHIYCKTLGYHAIAHWSVSGSDMSVSAIKDSLAPGHVYLFHTTDKDLAKLQEFVPYAVSQGYRLVTLNEMFGLPVNEVKPLDGAVTDRELPLIGRYSMNPRTYEVECFAWGAYLIQEKLVELGYLDGEPDAIYGSGTAAAIKKFQRDNGLEATGKCDPETQRVLFKDDPETLHVLQGGLGYEGPILPETEVQPTVEPQPTLEPEVTPEPAE